MQENADENNSDFTDTFLRSTSSSKNQKKIKTNTNKRLDDVKTL